MEEVYRSSRAQKDLLKPTISVKFGLVVIYRLITKGYSSLHTDALHTSSITHILEL